MVISSNDQSFNATIGGPHESFSFMVNYFGSVPMLFAHMQQELDNFNEFGPRKLSHCLMSDEDLMFAKQFNEVDVQGFDDDEILTNIQFHDDESSLGELHGGPQQQSSDVAPISCEEFFTTPNLSSLSELHGGPQQQSSDDFVGFGELHGGPKQLQCHTCPDVYLMNDEETSYLKSLQKSCEEGLTIEYRCPKCRSCSDCRNSCETERVSIREEAEDQMVRLYQD